MSLHHQHRSKGSSPKNIPLESINTYIGDPGVMKLMENACGNDAKKITRLLFLTALRYDNRQLVDRLLHLNNQKTRQGGIYIPLKGDAANAHRAYTYMYESRVREYPDGPKSIQLLQERYPFFRNQEHHQVVTLIEEWAGMVVSDRLKLLKQTGKIDEFHVYKTTDLDDIQGGADLVAVITKIDPKTGIKNTSIIAIDIAIMGSTKNIKNKIGDRSQTYLEDFNTQVLGVEPKEITLPRQVINIAPEQMQKFLDIVLQKLFNGQEPTDASKVNLYEKMKFATQAVLAQSQSRVAKIIRGPQNMTAEKFLSLPK